jgi:hypothetical protein
MTQMGEGRQKYFNGNNHQEMARPNSAVEQADRAKRIGLLRVDFADPLTGKLPATQDYGGMNL